MSLTKWELGQEIIRAHDAVGDLRGELSSSGHKDIAEEFKVIHAQIGDLFNKYSAHGFGIFDSAELSKQKGGDVNE